jgi:two-component system OmpR family response regulator
MGRVLVVEDDATLLDAVAYNLERDGHTVSTAADGMAGLTRAREDHPDLIVLDLMLPRMSGSDVCRLVRNEQPVPIIILTARDSEQDVIAGLDLGADDYVTKPFSMRELRARVNALLRRDVLSREAGPRDDAVSSDLLAAGGIEVDIGRHVVRKDGAEVVLRPREFLLLEYLMRHQGQVLSRDVILERVWGYTYAGESRTVDVHVRWLREKLEDDPSNPRHIQTVRGFGYRFAP